MTRPRGLPKSGGRKKGTPNKSTKDLLELLNSNNLNVPLELINLLPSLTTEKKVDVLMQLMAYLYPKRKAIDTNVNIQANTFADLIRNLDEKIKKSK